MAGLDEFPLVRLRAVWALREPVRLRGYLGNTFRGALGMALRRTVCAFPGRDCEGCSARGRCAWVRLFRTSSLHVHLSQGGQATPTSPLVIEPPHVAGAYVPGQELSMELVLVGDAIGEVAAVSDACECMGDLGLGTRRARMRLLHLHFVHAQGYATAYVPGHERYGRPPFPANLAAVTKPLPLGGKEASLAIGLLSPLRLRSSGELRREVCFLDLVAAADWRARQLAELCIGPVTLPSRAETLEVAERCEVVEKELRWEDWDTGWCSGGRCPTGGFVGHLRVRGDWQPLLPLLRLAEHIHVGNGATYGLGKIALA